MATIWSRITGSGGLARNQAAMRSLDRYPNMCDIRALNSCQARSVRLFDSATGSRLQQVPVLSRSMK
jgi:hypothetical protein